MSFPTLERDFRRRMLPVAAGTAVVLAIVPAAAYRLVAWQKLETQARLYATHIGVGVRRAAEHDPQLWRYNVPKILQAAASHRGQRDVARVRVTDCAGGVLFEPDRIGVGTGDATGPAGRAPVSLHRGTVAWVEVWADAHDERTTLARIAAASATLGGAVGLFVFVLPMRLVRRRARDIGEAVGRLQETERSRIGRDLHDTVGHGLAAIQIDLELARAHPEQASRRLADCAALCEETLADLRRVVHDLRPPDLPPGGFEEFLRTYTERFELRTGIAVALRTSGACVESGEVATCLFRILQEALTNVGRHAAAREVGITLAASDGFVSMDVTDDGRGFDPLASHGGAGLRGMRERSEVLGGTFVVESARGRGTRIRVRLPNPRAT